MKYKICVYAICKNEEQFVDRWYESMKEADEIYVLDTGSTDKTIEKLKNHNINVSTQKIEPWRFDVARNKSLELIPNDVDICVCTDLDEVFNKGWRKELERVWNKNTNRCRYIYNWSLDKKNNPIVSFYYEKIHSRDNYKWIYPVHEILEYNGNENIISTDKIILNHYPDNTKSRSSYLPLLELSVKENPNNDRNTHYLGREYMYYGKWNEAIDTLIKHINLNTSTWKDERSASMRFIARCYKYLNRFDEAKMWLDKAIEETPYLRDPFIEKAILEYQLNNYDEVIKNCLLAKEIELNNRTYINEVFSFDNTLYDLLSIAYFYKGEYNLALENIEIAINMNLEDERLKNNKSIIIKTIKNQT